MNVFKDDAIPLTHKEIEITDIKSLELLKEKRPDTIINTAAFHRVDDAEDTPEKAYMINSIGQRNVAKVAVEIGAIPVYISTDYVFDGEKNGPYTEVDVPNPVNTYGLSKLNGEIYTKNLSKRYYIFRVASLFGVAGSSGKGGNFVETMIKKAKNNEKIRVVDDMIMSPTYTENAAKIMKEIITNELPYGIYHITNSGYCSWFEFTRQILEYTNLKVDIKPIKTVELKMKAKRPQFSALTSPRLEKYGLKMPNWRDALRDYLEKKGHL